MVPSEVANRIWSAYEAGDLITTCAWCDRVELGGDWLLAPRAALAAIDARRTLSHTICPTCATLPARWGRSAAGGSLNAV